MEFGICNLAVVPLRATPNECSEQVSQILFGEVFEILEWQDKWIKLITAYDKYTGWINRLQFIMLGHMAYKQLIQHSPRLTHRAVTQAWKKIDNSILYLPAGSSLAFLQGDHCRIGNENLAIIGEIGDSTDIITTAHSFLNTPYLWGGRTHFGIDCSGFTQAVFKLNNIKIDRDASQQVNQGQTISKFANAQAGDLAFFENAEGRITHVGIMLNGEYIIHASGKVKIDKIDEKGIYSEEQKRYTHQFTCLRRYFESPISGRNG